MSLSVQSKSGFHFCLKLTIGLLNYINHEKSVKSVMCMPKLSPAPTHYSKAVELYGKYWDESSKEDKFTVLSANPDAIGYLKMNDANIDWNKACKNPSAVSRLMRNPDKINYYFLSSNPGAKALIEKKVEQESRDKTVNGPDRKRKDPRYLDWERLSENPAAIEVLKRNPEKINWYFICKNPAAIDMIRAELLKPRGVCRIKKTNLIANNPAALDLILDMLKYDPYMVNWDYIYANPSAIQMIRYIYRNCPEQINWDCLYENPAAIDLIEKHLKSTGGRNHSLKQLGEYNYWTEYSRKAFEESHVILERSDSWKADVRALFDRSNKTSRAKLDVKKYSMIKSFESVQKSLFNAYGVNNSESLIDRMQKYPVDGVSILCDVDPVRKFEELKMRRNILAHESEEWVDNLSMNSFGLTSREFRELRDYRTLKHFSFVQSVLMAHLDDYSWKTECIVKKTNWNAKYVRDLLGPNARKEYNDLRSSRNKVAHLIGERRC